MSSLVERATGKKLDPGMIEKTVRKVVEDKLDDSPDASKPTPAPPEPKSDSDDGRKGNGKEA